MSTTPEDRFNDWFSEDHGGTGDFEFESDADDVVEDLSFDDPESL